MAAALLLGGLAVACGGGKPPAPSAAPSPEPAVGRPIDPPAAAGALAPNLTIAAGRPALSWLERQTGRGHRLLVSFFEEEAWTPPVVVAEGEGFFANWADLPALAESGDGSLVAHWLVKTAAETYAYSIFLARSLDGGASWSELGRLNDDETPTEHGFVSWVAEGDGLRAFWLDGRAMLDGGAMALRTARVGETVGPSELVDERVCDCCSTGAALAAGGPLVVYRDRSEGEIRDVARVLLSDAGWSPPRVVSADGWRIEGCPVNGPEVDFHGSRGAAAWFTAGAGPEIRLAFSDDGGESFGEAVVLADETALGRVDVVLAADGAWVLWMETAAAEGRARIVLRHVGRDGAAGRPRVVAETAAARASGFPRLVRQGERLIATWIEVVEDRPSLLRAAVLSARRPAPAEENREPGSSNQTEGA